MRIFEHLSMNFLDIVTLVAILWALVSGWRSGFVSQLFSLIGIALGAIFSLKYGAAVGAMLGVDARFATAAGFLITFVVILVVATILSKLLARILSFIGLGWINTTLGVAFSLIKSLLVLSLLFVAIESVNKELNIIEMSYFENSLTFDIVRSLAKPMFDYFAEAKAAIMQSV